MILGHSKDNGFTWELPRLIFVALFPDFLPLFAQGILVAHCLFQVSALVVQLIRVNPLFVESVALFLAEIDAFNALALEAGPGLIEAVIDQVAIVYGLFISIEEGGRTILTIESQKCIAINEIGWRGGQADETAIEVLEDFIPFIENGAMDFVKDNQIEKSRSKRLETSVQSLQGHSVEATGRIDSM